MSNPKSSAAVRPRAYHQLSVNINGVTKNVLVPMTVSGESRAETVVAASSTTPPSSSVPERDISSVATAQQAVNSDGHSPRSSVSQGPSQFAGSQLVALINHSTAAPSILRPEVHNLVKSVIGSRAEPTRGVVNQAVRPVLPPRMVQIINEAPVGHVQVATTNAIPTALKRSVCGAAGSRPSPTVAGSTWKNRPTVVLTKTSPPKPYMPLRPTTNAQRLLFQPVSKPFQMAPVLITNAAIRPSSRPVLLVRPEINTEPSIISNARSLSVEEAAAVGWLDATAVTSKPSDVSAAVEKGQLQPVSVSEHTVTNTSSEHSIRDHTLPHNSFAASPMTNEPENSTQTSAVHDEGGAAGIQDTICVVDSETQMKVIEICPDDIEDDTDDLENDDKKQEVRRTIENCRPTKSVDDDQRSSRHSTPTSSADCSRSDSVETTVASESERMMNAQEGTSDDNVEDFVVLAEWWDDKGKRRPADRKLNRELNQRKAPKGKRRKRQKAVFSNAGRRRRQQTVGRGGEPASEPCRVQKARRTGGRPKTATEKFGIVNCLVSAERIRLPAGKLSIEAVDIRKHSCCCNKGKFAMNAIASRETVETIVADRPVESKPQLITAVQPQCSTQKSDSTSQPHAASDFKISENRQPLPSAVTGPSHLAADSKVAIIAPNSAVAASIRCASAYGVRRGMMVRGAVGATLPTAPSSGVEGTPLLLHRVDGKPSAIVVARPAADSSRSKDKFLLIRTKTGAYLVPMDDGGTGTTASTVAGLIRSHRESCDTAGAGRRHLVGIPRFPGMSTSPTNVRRWAVVNVRSQASTLTTRLPTVRQQEPALMFIKQEKSPTPCSSLSLVQKQTCTGIDDHMSRPTSAPVAAAPEERAVDDKGTECSATYLTPAKAEQNDAPAAGVAAVKPGDATVSAAPRSRKRKRGRGKYTRPVKTSTVDNSWTPVMTAACDVIRSTDPHRERIETLKERLRQQEEKLMELKRQKMQNVTASE